MATWELSTSKYEDFGQKFPQKILWGLHLEPLFLGFPSGQNFTTKKIKIK
jgi:hypothetical protein